MVKEGSLASPLQVGTSPAAPNPSNRTAPSFIRPIVQSLVHKYRDRERTTKRDRKREEREVCVCVSVGRGDKMCVNIFALMQMKQIVMQMYWYCAKATRRCITNLAGQHPKSAKAPKPTSPAPYTLHPKPKSRKPRLAMISETLAAAFSRASTRSPPTAPGALGYYRGLDK